MDYEENTLSVIGLEEFVAMKLHAGGPTEIEDARRAMAVSGSSLNVILLETLAARFAQDVAESLKKLQRE